MSKVHMILQGKGGVGKSLVASILAQHVLEKNKATEDAGRVICVDTDPVNATFAQYKAFHAQRLNLLNASQNVDTSGFDDLVEMIDGLEEADTAIIDNGASSFIPLASYLGENKIIDLLTESGHTVYIHTVLTGGQALDDTITGLRMLLKTQSCQVVVWVNNYFGDVSVKGLTFTASDLYKDNEKRIAGIVTLEHQNPDTFGKTIKTLVENKLTFDEGMADTDLFSLVPRQRLKLMKTDIFAQLDKITF